jgi:hypothetical protein
MFMAGRIPIDREIGPMAETKNILQTIEDKEEVSDDK